MKTMTVNYQISMAYLVNRLSAAIIVSDKVCFENFKYSTLMFQQILFGAYNVFDGNGKMLFNYGDNGVYSLHKIAKGKINVGYEFRNLVKYGTYCSKDRSFNIEPIDAEKLRYTCENYLTVSEKAKLIEDVREMIQTDPNIDSKSYEGYKKLLDDGEEYEFLCRVIKEIAILSDVKGSGFDPAAMREMIIQARLDVMEARKNVANMSKARRDSAEFELIAENILDEENKANVH